MTAAVALAAFAMIGAGMLAFAAAAWHSGSRAWAVGTAVIALVFFVTGGTYTTSNGNLSDLMLFIGGVAVLPAWLNLDQPHQRNRPFTRSPRAFHGGVT